VLESGLETREQPLVEHEPLAEQVRDHRLGHIVPCGPETTGGDHEPRTVQGFGQPRADRLGAVGDRGTARDLRAGGGEGAAQLGGVRVHGVAEQ